MPFAAGERGFEGTDVVVVAEEAAVSGLVLFMALGTGGFFNAGKVCEVVGVGFFLGLEIVALATALLVHQAGMRGVAEAGEVLRERSVFGGTGEGRAADVAVGQVTFEAAFVAGFAPSCPPRLPRGSVAR